MRIIFGILNILFIGLLLFSVIVGVKIIFNKMPAPIIPTGGIIFEKTAGMPREEWICFYKTDKTNGENCSSWARAMDLESAMNYAKSNCENTCSADCIKEHCERFVNFQ